MVRNNNNSIVKRVFLAILLVLFALWLHPILAIIVSGIIGLLMYPKYYEILVIGIISDIIYQSLFSVSFVQVPFYTTISLVVFILVYTIGKRMNMYA